MRVLVSTWNPADVPLYAAIEAASALVAFVVAGLCLIVRRGSTHPHVRIIAASAFLAMGAFDALHAAMGAPDNLFAWFHGLSTLSSGLLLASLWLPARIVARPRIRRLPAIVLLATLVVAAFSLAYPRLLPSMVQDGDFNSLADALDLIGGLGFLSAAVYLLVGRGPDRSLETTLFACTCATLGVAGVLFTFSSLGSTIWWLWHFTRLLACMVAIAWVGALFHGVQERLNDANRELRRALERERSATRAKDEFLAVLSHELRTPLQSMLGWSQILRARCRNEPSMQKGLETIERNVKTQAVLIEDLLEVSRIVAGKLRMERRPVELVKVVEAALGTAKTAAEAKGVRLEAKLERLAADVNGDPDRLQQIVWNLLSNAVKFTPPGGRVSVRLERDDATAGITVDDTGCGISPEFLPKVFERFRQEDSTMARAHGGLGLGLAIVRYLVEAHGGTVTAVSPGEGRGATFTVLLPLIGAEQATTNGQPVQKAAEEVGAAPTALRGVRVLVVDDDDDAREVVAMSLREEGAEVRAERSAQSALDALEAYHPDLLLSDIGMAGEDGYALIQKVRAIEAERGGHVPAVALTAFASHADREQALAVGFEAHIAKPASPEHLASVVATLVGRAAA